jgi:hypothetical protein
VFLLAIAACNNQTPAPAPAAAEPGTIANPGETVLSVNGVPIGANELDLVFKRMKIPDDQRSTWAWTRGGKHVAEEYALATVLYHKALDEKLYDDPEVQLQLAFAARQILGAAEREKLAKSAVTEDAIKKYYEDNKARFDKPEVRARQIQVADEATAKDVYDRLKKGESFEQLAKDHSVDQLSKAKGGDVGWFHEHENPLWGDAAFAAKKGDLIGPLQTRVGWHVIEVTDRRDSTPIEDVRDEAIEQIQHQQAVTVLDGIRSEMKVEWVKQPEGDAPGGGGAGPGGVATPGEAPPEGAPPAGAPPVGELPPGHPAGN